MYLLSDRLVFPDPDAASPDGLLAVGGDLSVERLLLAYDHGIFPWYNEGDPILWWSPDPRFVLFPDRIKVSKSMRQFIRRTHFKITHDQAFSAVIQACAQVERDGQPGTWITSSMIEAYERLHDLGYARSVEVWDQERLVGGLYGVDLGYGIFCGESMFARSSNASKLAFVHLVQNHHYKLIDCQVHTPHLESLGAEKISRNQFLQLLHQAQQVK